MSTEASAPTLPARMRAIQVRRHGGPEVLELVELDRPEPAADEVLIEVKACGLNHLDLWVRRGIEGHPFPLPIVPCGDISGVVRATGSSVRDYAPGDAIIVSPGVSCGQCAACNDGRQQFCRRYGILGESGDGGAREFLTVGARNLVRKPERLSFVEAAALPVTFLTAWTMVHRRAQVQPGETVLVQAGGSGVGVALIQMCKALGAKVVSTAGSAAKVARLEELGVDCAINYREDDVAARVKEFAGRGGVEVIFDHVGADTFALDQRLLAWAGRLVICGATTGHEVQLDLRRIFFKSQSVLGSTMGSYGDFARVVELVGQGLFSPVIDRVFPLEEMAQAQEHLEARRAFGKVILEP